jgi:hypothetical protein
LLVIGLLVSLRVMASATRGKDGRARPERTPRGAKPEKNLNHYHRAEAFSSAGYGDVLVVDNGGRADEACVGDLVVLEAQAAAWAGSWYGGCTATRRN